MIRTSVTSCLSSVLAKNNKIESILWYFTCFFGHFGILAFIENRGTNRTPKLSIRMFLVDFSKVQQLINDPRRVLQTSVLLLHMLLMLMF